MGSYRFTGGSKWTLYAVYMRAGVATVGVVSGTRGSMQEVGGGGGGLNGREWSCVTSRSFVRLGCDRHVITISPRLYECTPVLCG